VESVCASLFRVPLVVATCGYTCFSHDPLAVANDRFRTLNEGAASATPNQSSDGDEGASRDGVGEGSRDHEVVENHVCEVVVNHDREVEGNHDREVEENHDREVEENRGNDGEENHGHRVVESRGREVVVSRGGEVVENRGGGEVGSRGGGEGANGNDAVDACRGDGHADHPNHRSKTIQSRYPNPSHYCRYPRTRILPRAFDDAVP